MIFSRAVRAVRICRTWSRCPAGAAWRVAAACSDLRGEWYRRLTLTCSFIGARSSALTEAYSSDSGNPHLARVRVVGAEWRSVVAMVPRRTRRYEDLPPSARRAVVTLALLRAALTVAVLVTVYYLVPLNGLLDSEAAAGLLAGLATFTAIITWQIREIARSENPRLRAIQTLATGLPLLLLIFALTYVVLARNQPGSFSEPLNRTGALYFTVTVFSTVGFGDITARSEPARVIVMTQMLVDLVVVGVIAKLIFGAVQVSVQRRTTSALTASDTAGARSDPE